MSNTDGTLNIKKVTVANAIDTVMREDKGRLLAGLISRLNDFSTAEDALQEALILALDAWQKSGIPKSPPAWIMKVALNKAIDRYRANSREERKVADFERSVGRFAPTSVDVEDDLIDVEQIRDERLRLIFTCCHPALEEKSRVALTLRTVCQLTTQEIAEAFLDHESTMAQRLSRTKAKIRKKGIRYAVPDSEIWADRLGAVLSTIYLIFTTGYLRETPEPRQLCHEALFLSRLLLELCPGDAEIEGALALMLLTDARREARVGNDGASIPVDQQDRSKWADADIEEGQALLLTAIQRRSPGPFQIKAAIADCHMAPSQPDWQQMSLLYQSLWLYEPTSVVALNWAVVMAEMGQIDLAQQKINSLQSELTEYQPWYAARAKVLALQGLNAEALAAYSEAIARSDNRSNVVFLEKMRAELEATS